MQADRRDALSVEEFIKDTGIPLTEKDLMFPDKSALLLPNLNIEIQRPKKIIVSVDKEKKELYGFKETVGEIISENNLNIKEEDLGEANRD